MSPLALSLRLLQAQPDERLLALSRGGHEPAFEALVRRYRRQLLAYCRRLAVPQTSPEDVLQQALMQAWSALASGVEVQDARAWLYRIVHNTAISATRKAGEDPAQLSHELSAVAVEQVVEHRLAAREALAGVAALPELQREVILGTAVEGRSHEEVAAALGLTSGSVRGLLYRARSTLRAAAAALIPTPLIHWAARHEPRGRGGQTGVVEAVAGGGSAGVAGTVLKGGAVVTVAGALAGTAAVVSTHRPHAVTPDRDAIAAGGAGARHRLGAAGSGLSITDPIAFRALAAGASGSAAFARGSAAGLSGESGVAVVAGSGEGAMLEPVRLPVGDHRLRSPASNGWVRPGVLGVSHRGGGQTGPSRPGSSGSGTGPGIVPGAGRTDSSGSGAGRSGTGSPGPSHSGAGRAGGSSFGSGRSGPDPAGSGRTDWGGSGTAGSGWRPGGWSHSGSPYSGSGGSGSSGYTGSDRSSGGYGSRQSAWGASGGSHGYQGGWSGSTTSSGNPARGSWGSGPAASAASSSWGGGTSQSQADSGSGSGGQWGAAATDVQSPPPSSGTWSGSYRGQQGPG
jgi:RNA polymerase sigma factor (sigma-70 family)